jgi:hypothetical protein
MTIGRGSFATQWNGTLSHAWTQTEATAYWLAGRCTACCRHVLMRPTTLVHKRGSLLLFHERLQQIRPYYRM